MSLSILIMDGTRQDHIGVATHKLSALINIISTVIFARWLGIAGAAFSTGLSMFVTSGLIMNWYYEKKVGLDIKKFWKSSGSIIVSTALLTVFALVLKNVMWRDSVSVILFGFGIVFFTAMYVVIMFIFVMNDEERKQILKLFSL